MLVSYPSRRLAACVLVTALSVVGCGPAPSKPAVSGTPGPAATHAHADDHEHEDDHDHDHAHPGTLAEGVAALAKAAAALKDHLAADSHDAADDAVHDLGHLLEDLQGLVGKSELSADAKAAATKALDDLFECFGTLDDALHAEPGKGDSPADVHGSIAKRVDDAVAALRAAVQAKATAVADEAASIIEGATQKEDR